MRQGVLFGLILLVTGLSLPLYSQSGDREAGVVYRSVILDPFDSAGDAKYAGSTYVLSGDDQKDPPQGTPIIWKVIGSKFRDEGYPRMVYAPNIWPENLFGYRGDLVSVNGGYMIESPQEFSNYAPEDTTSLGVMGIRSRFLRQGFNSIQIIPGFGEGDDWKRYGIEMIGEAKSIDLWVWGSNYVYYVEFTLRDYDGITHIVKPLVRGSENPQYANTTKFTGWKNMTATIPTGIRQSSPYQPKLRPLKFEGITLISDSKESVEDFTIYLDHLSIFTNVHSEYFDGYELGTPEKVLEIWDPEAAEAAEVAEDNVEQEENNNGL